MQIPPILREDSQLLSGVRHAIAVASAKGGVGKSTVSLNLAFSLARLGARVGLLDADFCGPSIPLMVGVCEEPRLMPNNKMAPILKDGVALMSIGFIAGRETPVVWRGPLLAQALRHFLTQVEWGERDFLLIDLPPGTGDVPLTLSQTLALSGAVIVTTPQDVALQDVERGIAMFEKVDVDILGVIENMSYYCCPHCGTRHEIFSHGGGRRAADRLGLRFLGEVPLLPVLCLEVAPADSAEARLFDRIAAGVVEEIQRLANGA